MNRTEESMREQCYREGDNCGCQSVCKFYTERKFFNSKRNDIAVQAKTVNSAHGYTEGADDFVAVPKTKPLEDKLEDVSEKIKKNCECHYKVIPGDEINSILSVCLRIFNKEQLIVLRDALNERL